MSSLIAAVSNKIKELRDISKLLDDEVMPGLKRGDFKIEVVVNRGQLNVEIDSAKTDRWGTLFSSKTRLDQPKRMEEMAALYGFDSIDDALIIKEALIEIEKHLDKRITANKDAKSGFMGVF